MKDQILDLILSRRTIHNYLNEKVPTQYIENAVWAGVHAPNHKHTWPWRFYLLGSQARGLLAQKNPKFSSAGEMLVLAIKKATDPNQAKEDYASLACAVQNMSLYLWQHGFGTKWSTGKLMKTEGLYEAIGQSPEQIEICGIFWIGYADSSAPKPPDTQRPELKSFLSHID